MDLLRVIKRTHVLPPHKRPLKLLNYAPAGISNPVYEIENFLRDCIVLDTAVHNDRRCDNPECLGVHSKDKSISEFRYYCIDCVPGHLNFCSDCAVAPGQGIEHDPSHRLVQLLPTTCAICQGVTPLEERKSHLFQGTYREYSASGGTLRRVAQARACGFCAFLWTALLQRAPDGVRWPPGESEVVTIRIRTPGSRWLNIAVNLSARVKERETKVDHEGLTVCFQDVDSMEREVQVGLHVEQSLQMPVNPLTDNQHAVPIATAKVQKDSGSDDALSLAKMWLDNCRQRHITSCSEFGKHILPTRLIEVRGKDPGRVYLRETHGEEACEYAALSYCWGRGDPGLITTKSNLDIHCNEGIEIEKLPRTIREAIHATEKLDIGFLWVDRLCIIQDSPDDWAHEAALMCAVYSGAALTLSADGSGSAEEGLFQTDQALSRLKYQSYVDPEGIVTPLVLIEPRRHPTTWTRTQELSQPLDSRAWTMQESLMSRRLLHFTSDEMVWECETLTECECRRQSRPSRRELSPKGLEDMGSIYEKWCEIALAYAKRSLANESDKLPALRGLVERFQLLIRRASRAGQPDEYLAGLWRGDLVAQLAWKPPTKSDLQAFLKATSMTTVEKSAEASTEDPTATWMTILRERVRGQDWHEHGGYIAPSWSWAHLRGPMSYLRCNPRTPFVSYADVIEARTVPVDAKESTGQVSSGLITLSGHMVRGLECYLAHGVQKGGEVEGLSYLTKETNAHSWLLQFEPDESIGLIKRRGNCLNSVLLFLLGTKDVELSGKELATAKGLSEPLDRSRRRRQETQEGILEAGVESLGVSSSLPEELIEIFSRRGVLRSTSFLVLIESQEQKGRFERIGCFDVWGSDETEAVRTLFFHSVKDQITII